MTTKRRSTPAKVQPAKKSVPASVDQFLPDDYRVPKKRDQFMKLEPGTHNIRIMTAPIRGWVFFSEPIEDGHKVLRPVRRTEELGDFTAEEMIAASAKTNEKGELEGSRHFWILLVYNYALKRFQVLEITQVKLLDQLMALYKNEHYGDMRDYDIAITRTGTGKNDSKYNAIPAPPKLLAAEIQEQFEELKYNLNAILDNEYPIQ